MCAVFINDLLLVGIIVISLAEHRTSVIYKGKTLRAKNPHIEGRQNTKQVLQILKHR